MPATADWTQPRDWSVDELVTAALLNEQLRDNLEFLKNPPTDLSDLDEASDYSTTSTSFVDIDATNLAQTIETEGGDVLVTFTGTVSHYQGAYRMYFDIDVDGARQGGDDGIFSQVLMTQTNPYGVGICLAYWIQGLEAGSHTFKLQWKMNANTGYLFAGAGTSGADLHPQFTAREVS